MMKMGSNGLIVHENFIDHNTCELLIEAHRQSGSSNSGSDNGFYVPMLRGAFHKLAMRIVSDLCDLVQERFQVTAGCDMAVVCAIYPNGFRHSLHADNAQVVCPRHGANAEALVRIGCTCDDIHVAPNHTPWRSHTALLYLNDSEGGHIVFGGGPNIYRWAEQRVIRPTQGLLLLSPSDENYFHSTTPVERGVRYSLNCWFTADRNHQGVLKK